MEPIFTYKERCRRCYTCVRSCPVKAIKVDEGFVQIIYDRRIGCGNSLSCPQKAKVVVDRMVLTQEMLASGTPVVAVLGCSFPAFFHTLQPGQLVAALKSLGVSEVHRGGVRRTHDCRQLPRHPRNLGQTADFFPLSGGAHEGT